MYQIPAAPCDKQQQPDATHRQVILIKRCDRVEHAADGACLMSAFKSFASSIDCSCFLQWQMSAHKEDVHGTLACPWENVQAGSGV